MRRLVFSVLGMVIAAAASAQNYPVKPIRLVSPYPPGGANDILARIIGQKLGENLGQQIVIENRGGATGNIGAEYVAKAAPDGYTILMGTGEQSHDQREPDEQDAVRPGQGPGARYARGDDAQPAGRASVAAGAHGQGSGRARESQTRFRQLCVSRQRQRGPSRPASCSSASRNDMAHIPYKGAAPALTDVVAGQAQIYFTSPISATPFVKGGRLRMVAVTSLKRSPSLPDIPTVAESGYPDFDVVSWWGILTPAGVPKDIIAKLHTEIVKVLALPEIKAKFADQGADVASDTPEHFAAYIKSEIAKWAKLIKELGVKSE